jgi:MoaA/NifB/PqqE/SkfB family radical SAM enzyme
MPVPLPKFVQIEPVGQCNLRCRMCAIQFREDGAPGRPAFMPFDTFASLLGQFDGLTELHLQGLGEPLLHPRFCDMVALAAGRGIKVSTNTNMSVMSERLAARCVESGLHTVHVSIDGASAANYEAIRLGARFDNLLRNLRRLVAAKGSSTLPHIAVVMVLMRRNLDELPALVRLAAGEGAESLSVQQLCHDFSEGGLPAQYLPMRAFVDQQALTAADLPHALQVFDAAHRAAQAEGILLRLPRLAQQEVPRTGLQEGTRGGAPGRCDWPWRGAYLSYDGKAMPCCMVGTPDRQNFGNAASEGVEAIWNSAAYDDFRARLASSEPPDICAGCAVYRGLF